MPTPLWRCNICGEIHTNPTAAYACEAKGPDTPLAINTPMNYHGSVVRILENHLIPGRHTQEYRVEWFASDNPSTKRPAQLPKWIGEDQLEPTGKTAA